MPNGNDDELFRKHNERRETDWVPYTQRRSLSPLRFIDDGEKVTVLMEVATLGTLVLSVTGVFNSVSQKIHWDQTAEMRAAIK